jgi:hypothetical protein
LFLVRREDYAGRLRLPVCLVVWKGMALGSGFYASQLRMEILERNRICARGRAHVESYGNPPVLVYAPDEKGHGNFYGPAYHSMVERPEWLRRFDKVHTLGGRSLPKAARRWRELDSSASSDALLMNVFCTPGVVRSDAVRGMLGIEDDGEPRFGWRARVPLANGRLDRTEVDLQWGGLLVEAKLTEADFQCCRAELLEVYRDLDQVFDRELLPRVEIPGSRRKTPAEFPEEYTQEEVVVPAEEWQPTRVETPRASIEGYASYQLIRNVLAAYAQEASFCVIHDARRPDLREEWFRVMAAVRPAELRVRLKVLTWQELVPALPDGLQAFLREKYGLVAAGEPAAPLPGREEE